MRWTLLGVLLGVSSLALGEPPKAGAKPVVATAASPDAGTPAAGGAQLDGAQLFMQRTCFACHGKDAKTPVLPEYPRLAGQGAIYAERQMKDIKSGARSNGNTAAMKGIMPLVTDDEIHALAVYISTLK